MDYCCVTLVNFLFFKRITFKFGRKEFWFLSSGLENLCEIHSVICVILVVEVDCREFTCN